MASFSDEHECHCEHPFRKGEKLMLCGSELCKKLTSKSYRNDKDLNERLILREDEE